MDISQNDISTYGVIGLVLLTFALVVFNYIEGNGDQMAFWNFMLILQIVLYYGVNYEPDWEKMSITEETCPNCKGTLYRELGHAKIYYCDECSFSGSKEGGWFLHAFRKRLGYAQRKNWRKCVTFWKNKNDLSIKERLSRYRQSEFLEP